jgi:anaerobic selenocysteine-containing dehydrogenase
MLNLENQGSITASHAGSGEQSKQVVCTSCDGFCPVSAKVVDGRVTKVTTRDHPMFKGVLCMKGAYAPKHFSHPDRVLYPLKRVGERGSGEWERVSWDDAMDDIATRLQKVIDQYGPEAFAVAQSGATGVGDNGLCRRFMNYIGTPNWIGGVSYCAGNTAAINRYVYGWFPRADILNSKCIVLIGHDPRRHSWTMEYKAIRMAQANGAKLIVVDPRRSENAERADVWLPLRSGTDAALLLGWLNVIIEEKLYDADFVKNWTVGFDELAERAREYPLGRVSQITGVESELIVEAARMYASSGPACIPWTPVTDQQVSSTSAIRLQCMLRAICGHLDVEGGDQLIGFNPAVRSDSEIENHEILAPEQKAKQLGADQFPAFTYRGTGAFSDASEKVWNIRWANLVGGCYMAHPMALFKAMAESDPYPVRALFAIANNVLAAFANSKRAYEGMMKQDLIVAFEHAMSPTAQIADYVLPGDSWLERPSMQAGISEQAMQPPGECRNVVYFWHQLAKRMGLEEHFPWATPEALFDYRFEPGGKKWADVVGAGRPPNLHKGQAEHDGDRKYLKTGFATPSGKVELYSDVLKDLGFDPLPYYREAMQTSEQYPLASFVGWPEDEFFRSGHRQVPELRKRAEDPIFYMCPKDTQALDMAEGQWVRLETTTGKMFGRVFAHSSMPKGLVRIPHGWWKPESRQGGDHLSGLWSFSDGQLAADDDLELVDAEQGVPHLKGCPCSVTKLTADEVRELEAEYGPTNDLPHGPEGKVLKSKALPGEFDFMEDEDIGEGIEFEAAQLSLYGRYSM